MGQGRPGQCESDAKEEPEPSEGKAGQYVEAVYATTAGSGAS